MISGLSEMTAEILNEALFEFLTSIKDANCDPWLDYEPRLCGKGRVTSFHETDLGHQSFGGLFFILRAD